MKLYKTMDVFEEAILAYMRETESQGPTPMDTSRQTQSGGTSSPQRRPTQPHPQALMSKGKSSTNFRAEPTKSFSASQRCKQLAGQSFSKSFYRSNRKSAY